jgi:hypothetical protein
LGYRSDDLRCRAGKSLCLEMYDNGPGAPRHSRIQRIKYQDRVESVHLVFIDETLDQNRYGSIAGMNAAPRPIWPVIAGAEGLSQHRLISAAPS